MSEEKKTHPEHKYSVTFVSKVGTIKQNEKLFFLKFEFFNENHPPTRNIKYKTKDFAACNKSIMANKLLSTNLERFLRRIKSPLTR